MNVRALAAALSLVLAACSDGASDLAGALAELPSPAGDGSGEPFLSTDRSGRVQEHARLSTVGLPQLLISLFRLTGKPFLRD